MATSTITLEQEINPWEAQSARFDFAARKLNLDPGLWKVLSSPSREIIVHFPVLMEIAELVLEHVNKTVAQFRCCRMLRQIQ